MDVIRTEPGSAPCNVVDFIEGYRADATQNSPLAQSGGDEPFFELTIEVIAADDPDRLGSSTEALAIFHPHAQNIFTLEASSPSDDGSTFFRNVVLVGTSVNLPPADAEANVQIVASNLVLDPATNSITGQVQTFSAGDGNETIAFTATPFVYAPTTNPYFTDDNAPMGFGVHVADLQSQLPLTGDPGGEAFQVDPNRRSFALTGTPDAPRKRYRDVQQAALYYAWKTSQNPGGAGELRRVRQDLATDGGGQGFDVVLADPIFEQPITNLWVESDMQVGGRDSVTFTTNGNPDQSYAVLVGAGVPVLQQMAGRAIAPVRDPLTGTFEGWVTESPTAGLVLRDASGTFLSTLRPAQAKSFQFLGATDAGDLFFSTWANGAPTASVAVLKRGQQLLTGLASNLGPFLPGDRIPADVQGDTLYFAHQDPISGDLGIFSMDVIGNITFLAQEVNWDVTDPRCEVAVAGNRVVYSIVEDIGIEPVILKSVRLDGSDIVELDRVGGHIEIFAISDRQVFYNDSFFPGGAPVSARSRSIHGDDAGPVEYGENSAWAAVQARASLDFARGPRNAVGQGSLQSGLAITSLAPGHQAENVILIDRRSGNEQVVVVDARSAAALGTLLDRDLDLGPGFLLAECSSGYQPFFLGEVSAVGQDIDVYQLDASGGSLVTPITVTPNVDEDILSR
jgi:hypothetical protein